MDRKRIAVIFGTRPDAIKMAPLILASKEFPNLEVIPISSGQHKEMLEPILGFFDIVPKKDAQVMKPGQSLDELTAKIILGLGKALDQVKPNVVLVHGDTTTALGGALAAFYRKLPIGHVEAGLRTETLNNPFPEEMNRRCVDRISSYHFAPTLRAKENLQKEGIESKNVIVTGNTIVDALDWAKRSAALPQNLSLQHNSKLILLTTHRRENIGSGMVGIFRAVRRIVQNNPEVEVVFPIHLNNLVRKVAAEELSKIDRVHIIEPVAYEEMVGLLRHSYLVMTDSGGLQEEAPALKKPVVVLRETTERPEIIEAGNGVLVGTDEEKIVQTVEHLLTNMNAYQAMATATNPYGVPGVAQKILSFLTHEDRTK